MSDRLKWNDRYREAAAQSVEPCYVLTEFAHLLPASGAALDLACGMGGNALFLAERGLETSAWDLSSVAIDKLRAVAKTRDITITAEERDVSASPPDPDSFDVIVVSRFLERHLMPAIVAALRPYGLLYYQTFIRDKVDDTGPSNAAYRLDDNELLRLCGGLHLRAYREEGGVGDITRGWRNEALLVGQRISH